MHMEHGFGDEQSFGHSTVIGREDSHWQQQFLKFFGNIIKTEFNKKKKDMLD